MPDEPRLLWYGRFAWAALGVLAVAVAVLYAAQQVRVLVVALVLALFPAALMSPVTERLRSSRLPSSLSALMLIVGLLLVFVLPAWLIIPLFASQLPELVDSVVRGLDQLEDAVAWEVLPGSPEGPSELAEEALAALGGEEVVGQGLALAATMVHLVTGLLLMLVVLFFCFKDGRRLWQGVLDLVPSKRQQPVDELAGQAWRTLGAYLRGQLLVALVDAVLIGLGLWALGVPLAFPLAVLVFFGGLFPIVGAFASGFVAVLVALADQGLATAGLVLLLIVVVQQVEGNLLEPLIMSTIIGLHPLVVILAVTAGGLLMGILGAFLAVPVAAILARVIDYFRGREPASGT